MWKNENAVSNKDFFESLVRERIKEGFTFVNWFDKYHSHQQSTFLFIKIL